MSKSGQISFLNIVAAGSKNPQSGRQNGGIYFPGFTKPGGEVVQARWEGNFFINSFGTRRNAQGQQLVDPQTGQPIPLPNKVIRLTAWNGRNAQPGKGLADLMAKCISVGKQFSCSCILNIYEANVRDKATGAVMQYSDGSAITTPRIGFTVVGGTFEFGNDSNKTVMSEIAAWDFNNPNMDIYFRRPPQWNIPNTPDAQAWETLRALRQSQNYIQGNQEYGFARVASVQQNAQYPVNGQPVMTQPMTGQVANAVNNQVVYPQQNMYAGVEPTTGQPLQNQQVIYPQGTMPAGAAPGQVVMPQGQQVQGAPQMF